VAACSIDQIAVETARIQPQETRDRFRGFHDFRLTSETSHQRLKDCLATYGSQFILTLICIKAVIVIGSRLQDMKLMLNHFCVLFAAIILIAGSAMVSSAPGLAGEAWGIAVELGVADDSTAFLANGSDSVTRRIAATAQDSHHNGCCQDCSTNCVSSTGSGCCGAAVPLTSGCETLDRASIAAYGLDAGFLGTGINPEALLQPPRFFA
jgi:hypothetical protein